MKKSITEKLAASVREAKQQQNTDLKPDAPQETPVKRDQPESTVKPLPSRRVWPD